jgi:repressor LexA
LVSRCPQPGEFCRHPDYQLARFYEREIISLISWALFPWSAAGTINLEQVRVLAYSALTMKKAFTDKQGQYLAFIYYYSKIHGTSPSEAELQRYFRVSPPSVHQMILTLERRGFIERTPGQARSIHLLISRENLCLK